MHIFKTWDEICCKRFIMYSHMRIDAFHILCDKDGENMVGCIGLIEPPVKLRYFGFTGFRFPHALQFLSAKMGKFFNKIVTDLLLRPKGYINQYQVLRRRK